MCASWRSIQSRLKRLLSFGAVEGTFRKPGRRSHDEVADSKLVALRRGLARTNAQAFDGLAFDLEPIANQIVELTKWVNGSASPNPESDIVLDAVRRFASSGSVGTLRDLQLVAFGCMVPFGSSNRRLIADGDLFSSLLSRSTGWPNMHRSRIRRPRKRTWSVSR